MISQETVILRGLKQTLITDFMKVRVRKAFAQLSNHIIKHLRQHTNKIPKIQMLKDNGEEQKATQQK